MTNGFRRIADATGSVVGSSWAFTANIALTAIWLLLGPVFQFSDTWQLTMNTAASQVTFLIAFLLQNTQLAALKKQFERLGERKGRKGLDG